MEEQIKDILESKEPIFSIKIGDKNNYSETKLFLNGDCFAKHYGDINKIPNSSLVNQYYSFVRRLELPPIIDATWCSGNLLTLFASYTSKIGEK